MGSLLEELARREAAVRQRIVEIREQIAALESRLEAEHDRLSRLMITRETVEEILGEATQLVRKPSGEAEAVAAGEVETHRVPDLTHMLRRDPGRPSVRSYRRLLREPVDADLLAQTSTWLADHLSKPG